MQKLFIRIIQKLFICCVAIGLSFLLTLSYSLLYPLTALAAARVSYTSRDISNLECLEDIGNLYSGDFYFDDFDRSPHGGWEVCYGTGIGGCTGGESAYDSKQGKLKLVSPLGDRQPMILFLSLYTEIEEGEACEFVSGKAYEVSFDISKYDQGISLDPNASPFISGIMINENFLDEPQSGDLSSVTPVTWLIQLSESGEPYYDNRIEIYGNSAYVDNFRIVQLPTILLPTRDFEVTEGEDKSVNIPVSLDYPAKETVSVDYEVKNVDPEPDLAGENGYKGTLTIEPDNTEASLTILVLDDDLIEEDETLSVLFSAPENAVLQSEVKEVFITVHSDDVGTPIVSIIESESQVTEGKSASIPLVMDPGIDRSISVSYSLEEKTATENTDYLNQGNSVTFSPYETEVNIIVPTIDNDFYEDDEEFLVNVSSSDVEIDGSQVTVTIVDDAQQPSINADERLEVREGETLEIPIRFTGEPYNDKDISVDYEISNTDPGTTNFAEDDDYIINSGDSTGTFYFNPDVKERIISVTAKPDNETEGPETFEVTLSDPTEGAVLLHNTSTVTILDGAPLLTTLKVADSTADEDESLRFDVNLESEQPQNPPITVEYVIEPGTAIQGNDYECRDGCQGILSFDPEDKQRSVYVDIFDDGVDEEDETLTLILSNPQPTGIINVASSDLEATGTIHDNDPRPIVSIESKEVREEDETVTLTVYSEHPSDHDISIGYNTQNGSAVKDDDFDEPELGANVIIEAGAECTEIEIPIIDDSLPEENESFYVFLQDFEDVAVSVPGAEVTILDNDSDNPEEWYPTANARGDIAYESSRDEEINGSIQFVVYLTGPVDQPVTVHYATESNINEEDSALPDVDYYSVDGDCTFDLELECPVTVELHNDDVVEDDESFYLRLSSNSSGVVVSKQRSKAIIIDDDTDNARLNTASVYRSNWGDIFRKLDLTDSRYMKGDLTNLVIGDFNGDGADDFIRQEKEAWDDGNDTASVYLSNGDGTFYTVAIPLAWQLQGDVTNLIVGDFNGDGADDFIRQEKGSWDDDVYNTANIFLSRGDGTFDRQDLTYAWDMKGDQTNLIVGDFNGDGADDFIRQEKGSWDDDVYNTANIFLSRGNGTFDRQDLTYAWDMKGDQTNLIVGDFNGDGADDFIRQEKGSWDDDTWNTANIYLSNRK